MSSGGGLFNMDVILSLKERLAQVERERQEQSERADRQGLRAQNAERKRDGWKAAYERWTPGSEALLKLRMECQDLRAERDAALADLKVVRHSLGDALAKAEAADELAVKYAKEFDVARTETIALRARIEALADSRRSGGQVEISDRLYDLLQPAKPESALDVVAELEKVGHRS